MNEPTGQEILDLPMEWEDHYNDAGASTIREYLAGLAEAMWVGASPKRPFGNSDWEYELYEALARAGLIESHEDQWGEPVVDTDKADDLIREALSALGEKP